MRILKLPTNISKSRQVFLSLIMIFFLLVGLFLAVQLTKKRQELRKNASQNQVSLTLASDQTNLIPGQSFDVKILVDPPADASLKVTAVSTKVTYPTDKLTLNQVTAGSFFLRNFTAGQTEMLNIINTATLGIANLSLGAPCTSSSPWQCYPQIAGGTLFPLATLNFTVKTGVSGTASIGFDSANTSVAALDINNNPANNNQNVVDPGSLNILSLTITPLSTPTPIPTATPTPTPSPTPTPTPISTPDAATLNFSVKLQGISTQGPNKTAKLSLKNGQTFNRVTLVANSVGVYTGIMNNINPGNYEVLVKEPTRLQKNFGSVEFLANQTIIKDWTASILKAGDLNSDGTIEGTDLSILLGKIRSYNFEPIPSGTSETSDLNDDHYVEGTDLSLILSNIFQQEEQ